MGKAKNLRSAGKTVGKKLPVTLLSGFLGAGKTTLLKHILESNAHKLRIAVIVNDMAEVNIDASLIEKSQLIQTKEELVKMQNGCICCTLRTDLIREIRRLRAMAAFDYLVIESTGIAEPMQVAESFCADVEGAELAGDLAPSDMLSAVARLDTCVTVIDGSTFSRLATTSKAFKDVFGTSSSSSSMIVSPEAPAAAAAEDDAEGEKSIASLLIDQVEFANVIIVNKMDLISEDELAELQKLLRSLNPQAKVLPATFAEVPLDELLNTQRFDLEQAKTAAGWLQSLREPHNPETLEYGISSFVYRARRPFHPTRLHRWASQLFAFRVDWQAQRKRLALTAKVLGKAAVAGAGVNSADECAAPPSFGTVLRSKGFCWIAGRDETMGEWAQAGHLLELSAMRPWFCLQPEEDWGMEGEEVAAVRKDMDAHFGDRRQEIVFIGTKLNPAELCASLDTCLLNDSEMLHHALTDHVPYADPLPQWDEDVSVDENGEGFLWNTVLTTERQARFRVGGGTALELRNLALHTSMGDSAMYKVWLDLGDQRILLATLSASSPQTVVDVELPSQEESMSLLVEQVSQFKRKVSCLADSAAGGADGDLLGDAAEVHVLGRAVATESTGAPTHDDDHDGHDHGHDHAHDGCPL